MTFRLVRRYFDLVTDSGDAVFGYWASLKWGLVRVRYASIEGHVAGRPVARHARGASVGPARVGARIEWVAPRLGVTAAWEPTGPPIAATLFEREGRGVYWQCWAPSAISSMALSDTGASPQSLVGQGYVEDLVLEIEPWRIPLETLRWGRFATSARSVVWMQWIGAAPLALVFVDGVARAGAELRDDEISWRGGRLRLALHRVLRDAPLASGALAAIPKLLRVAPSTILSAHESKWLARAELIEAGVEPVTRGFALHAIVRF